MAIDAVVPEPGFLLLLASGLIGLAFFRRKRAAIALYGCMILTAVDCARAAVVVDIPALQDATLP